MNYYFIFDENAKKQLNRYTEVAKEKGITLTRGVMWEDALDVEIYGDLRMQIRTIDVGKIVYEFYYQDDGKQYWTTTSGARDYIDDNFVFTSDIIDALNPDIGKGKLPKGKR